MTLTKVISCLVRPSHLLVLALVLGGVLVLAGRRRAGRVLLSIAIVGLFMGGLSPLGGWLIAPLENRFPEYALPEHVDGIIVLAGGEQPAQTALHAFPHLNSFSDRVLTGVLLARRYPDATLIHSGRLPLYEDERSGEVTTASDVAGQVFRSTGVEDARLILEDAASNTCESPRAMSRLVRPQPEQVWLLVTSAFHMPRSVACFRAAGWQVAAVPVDFRQAEGGQLLPASLPLNLERLDLAVHEWLGLVYYRLRGWTSELFPAP